MQALCTTCSQHTWMGPTLRRVPRCGHALACHPAGLCAACVTHAAALQQIANGFCYTQTSLPSHNPGAQVCRAWRTVAASEALWRGKVAELEPHPHLRRDDLLPGAVAWT